MPHKFPMGAPVKAIFPKPGSSAFPQKFFRRSGRKNVLLVGLLATTAITARAQQTTAYFEYIGGLEDRMVETLGFQAAAAPPRFRLPNYDFAPPQGLVMTSAGLTQNRYPRFRGADLGSLPNGSALVVQKGRELTLYEKDPADYAITSQRDA